MNKIYHYTKLGTAIEHILPKMQLRTSTLHKMNDPKENQPWAFGGAYIDLKKSYPETYSDKTHIEHQFKLGNEVKRCCQIICFVKNEPQNGFLNEIMWAHYSDNHKGICLELDADIFIQENQKTLTDYIFESVSYRQHKSPNMEWKSEYDKEHNIIHFAKAHYKELYLCKSKYWERENETRLLIFDRNQRYLSIQKSLKAIYFGLLIPNEYRPSIDRYVNEEQTKLYNLYYESGKIKRAETKKNDNRMFIARKYLAND